MVRTYVRGMVPRYSCTCAMAFITRLIRRRVVQCFVQQKCLSDGHHCADSASGNQDQGQYYLKNVELVCPKQAFGVKSNWELFRGWMVFKMFTYNVLVDNCFKVNLNSFRNYIKLEY